MNLGRNEIQSIPRGNGLNLLYLQQKKKEKEKEKLLEMKPEGAGLSRSPR